MFSFLTVNIFHFWFLLLTLNELMFAGFILKTHILFKTRLCISGVILQYFKCKQNLLINSIWTYTSTALRVSQWKISTKEFILDVDAGTKMRLIILRKKRKHRWRTWLIRAQILQILWNSVHILTHALINICHPLLAIMS